jgi:flagellar hook assembly protein FlgD
MNLVNNEEVSIEQPMLSPDNDGVDDILKITLHPSENESYATISVYSPLGVKLKSILKNTLIAANEIVYWDGIDDVNQKIPFGTYIIYVEILSLSKGNSSQYKIPVYIVGKL